MTDPEDIDTLEWAMLRSLAAMLTAAAETYGPEGVAAFERAAARAVTEARQQPSPGTDPASGLPPVTTEQADTIARDWGIDDPSTIDYLRNGPHPGFDGTPPDDRT